MPNVSPAYRILVSVPIDKWLTPDQKAVKHQFLDMLRRDGFDPQIFGELGKAATISWTYDAISLFIQQCQGAVVLGLTRFEFLTQGSAPNETIAHRFTTEYSHVESALAIAHKIPIFITSEDGVYERGILAKTAGELITDLPAHNDAAWTDPNSLFMTRYKAWRDTVNARYHIFMGYSSKAAGTAALVKNHLQSNGVTVLDWKIDFMAGGSILGQIEQANKTCMGGIFLFTKDDEQVAGNVVSAAPRDNVIFEAGYFMNSKGDKHVLIIREDDAKMPADLGGLIYLSLKDRNDISAIENSLMKFIRDHF